MATIISNSERAMFSITAFIGIDPGVNGGIAIVGDDVEAEALPMPKTDVETWKWFDNLERRYDERMFACVELVGGYVGTHNRKNGDDGSRSNPGSAMFTFGQSYGALRMALTATSIPFEAVRPQAWQKLLELERASGMDQTSWKTYLRNEAAKLYPALKVTKRTADALLIARYAMMKWGK